VISLGGIVVSQSLRVGGYEFDEAIISYVKREYDIVIGQPTAEELKFEIGSAWPLETERETTIRGRDLAVGLPKAITLTSVEVREALEDTVRPIVDAVKETLELTPPELAADITRHGIMLAGGGALLAGLERRLKEETGMPTYLCDSPLTCVATGAGISLEEYETLSRSGGGGTGSHAGASRRGDVAAVRAR